MLLKYKKDYTLKGGDICLTWSGASKLNTYLSLEFMIDAHDPSVLLAYAPLFMNPKLLKRIRQLREQ